MPTQMKASISRPASITDGTCSLSFCQQMRGQAMVQRRQGMLSNMLRTKSLGVNREGVSRHTQGSQKPEKVGSIQNALPRPDERGRGVQRHPATTRYPW